MKVYEALPPLSPRAGFLRTVSGWRDAALVEFGPEGTMHYAQSAIHGETDFDFARDFKREVKNFVDSVEGKAECLAPAEDGVELMRILDAIYLSAKTGKSVDIVR